MRRLGLFLALVMSLVAGPAVAQAPQGASLGSPQQVGDPRTKPFVLYVSPASRKFLETVGPDLKTRVNLWRDIIAARGQPYLIVTHPDQLAQVPPAAALVVVSAAVLPDEERQAILKRVDAGEGLLATWMPGTLDAKGAAVAPTFIEQAFKVSAKPTNTGERAFLITAGDTPLTYGLPAGSRLWVGKESKFPTPLLETPGAGYLAEWSRAAGKTGLLSFTTVGTSRRALIGVPEVSWDAKTVEYVKLANLALDWVGGNPVTFVRTWPWPARGAVTLGVDALWKFENLPRISEAMSKAGVQGSFHFLSGDATTNAAAFRSLVQAGHSIGGFGDSTQPFAGQSEGEQRMRMERMVRGFRAALDPGVPVGGLRAPQGVTDAATERAAKELDYLVDSGRVDSLVPVLASDRHLVLLSASANLDSNATLDAVNASLDAAAQKAQLLGGHAFVGVDGAAYEPGTPMEEGLKRYLASVNERPLWNASALDVARWWRAHEGLKVASQWDAANATLTLDVTTAEAVPFPAAISISPPPGAKSLRLEVPPSAGAVQQMPDGSGGVAVVFNALPAGRHSVLVRFAP